MSSALEEEKAAASEASLNGGDSVKKKFAVKRITFLWYIRREPLEDNALLILQRPVVVRRLLHNSELVRKYLDAAPEKHRRLVQIVLCCRFNHIVFEAQLFDFVVRCR